MVVMNQGASEHIEAAAVVSQYCDIIYRAFAGLVDKEKDNAETVFLAGFLNTLLYNCEYGGCTGHPLQALAW
jgi:N-succinyl-L-ornithine transcarbamylase